MSGIDVNVETLATALDARIQTVEGRLEVKADSGTKKREPNKNTPRKRYACPIRTLFSAVTAFGLLAGNLAPPA